MSIPYDFPALIEQMVREGNRPPDGLLHPSTHLNGHLRHTQLDLAGAPKIPNNFANQARLELGTLMHERLHDYLRKKGVPHMPEVKLNPWLPEGWGGTADCLLWVPEFQAFVLVDYKTIEGKGVYYIDTTGAKHSHIWQVSSYLHACEDMGIPILMDELAVLYIPITEGTGDSGTRGPIMETVDPIEREVIHTHMAEIKSDTDRYLDSLHGAEATEILEYLTPELADGPEREQKLVWDKDKKIWHVRLVPPWGAKYCPYEKPLCTCSGLKTEKIGEYSLDQEYSPREGYEHVLPTVLPTDNEVNKRKR